MQRIWFYKKKSILDLGKGQNFQFKGFLDIPTFVMKIFQGFYKSQPSEQYFYKGFYIVLNNFFQRFLKKLSFFFRTIQVYFFFNFVT